MNDDRRRILTLLAEGKITADEADRLISALDRSDGERLAVATRPNGAPKYLRVEVDANQTEVGPTKVNIRVPMMLLRAGVRLSALIPPEARGEVNAAMAKQGLRFDINQLKPENLEELIEQLADLSVNVDNERANVRIYCE
jgi:hypothetical protein